MRKFAWADCSGDMAVDAEADANADASNFGEVGVGEGSPLSAISLMPGYRGMSMVIP